MSSDQKIPPAMSDAEVLIERRRYFSVHHMMMNVARQSLPGAQFNYPGQMHSCMTVIVMAAGAVEALANALGVIRLDHWEELDKLPPFVKLRLCFQSFGASIDRNAEPWVSVKWLARLRNKIIHGQPQRLSDARHISLADWTPQESLLAKHTNWPKSAIEVSLTAENAVRSVETYDAMIRELSRHLPQEQWSGIAADGVDMTTSPTARKT